MQRRWALPLAALLLAGLAAPAAPAPGQALQPVQVALDGLPGAVALAIAEAEDRLLSSEASRRLGVLHGYVQGFGSLPAGSAALADPATRDAYAWAEEAVEAALGLPAQFDALEEAGALCRAYGNDGTRQQVERALTAGPQAEATLAVLRSEIRSLAARFPAGVGVDRAPFDRTVRLLDDYMTLRRPAIHDCLATLHLPDRSAELPELFAVVLPPEAYRTGHARVVGTVVGTDAVAASSPTLSLSRQARAENGTFRIPFDVPRAAALGNHTVAVTAGSLRAEANLTVTRAETFLDLQAPSRVVMNTTFTALATVHSPAGGTYVDRVPVVLSWNGTDASVGLQDGTGRRVLNAGPPAHAVLVATFAGDDVLGPSKDTHAIEVYRPGAVASNGPDPSLTWVWWLLVLVGGVAMAILLYLMPVLLHRARGARGQALRGTPSPPRWPGAATFVAAVAALFDLLRRRRLAPAGQTFREWLLEHGGPAAMADRFDAVRYGDQPEDEPLRRSGLAWAEKAWARWRERP